MLFALIFMTTLLSLSRPSSSDTYRKQDTNEYMKPNKFLERNAAVSDFISDESLSPNSQTFDQQNPTWRKYGAKDIEEPLPPVLSWYNFASKSDEERAKDARRPHRPPIPAELLRYNSYSRPFRQREAVPKTQGRKLLLPNYPGAMYPPPYKPQGRYMYRPDVKLPMDYGYRRRRPYYTQLENYRKSSNPSRFNIITGDSPSNVTIAIFGALGTVVVLVLGYLARGRIAKFLRLLPSNIQGSGGHPNQSPSNETVHLEPPVKEKLIETALKSVDLEKCFKDIDVRDKYVSPEHREKLSKLLHARQ